MKAPVTDKDALFIETPNGIFTAAGCWFHTTVEALEAYAGPVLRHTTVTQLLRNAELWIGSPHTIVLWITPFILWRFGVLPTILVCAVIYLLLSIWAPLVIAHTTTPIVNLLDKVFFQALLYIAALSLFAMNDQFGRVGVGLGIFILLRWGVLNKVFNPLIQRLRGYVYKVPFEDQVLKSVIVRAAMKYRVALPELDKMERFIMKQMYKK